METPARLLTKRDISTILAMSRRDADEFFDLAACPDIVKKTDIENSNPVLDPGHYGQQSLSGPRHTEAVSSAINFSPG
jgi:hypothetical protein